MKMKDMSYVTQLRNLVECLEMKNNKYGHHYYDNFN